MKPTSLKTSIFLDSADPNETKEAISMLGFLDGQTTNPTLLAKNQAAKGNVLNCYREAIEKISAMVSKSVSVEVYADGGTSSEEMFKQAVAMNSWARNAHIKFPITHEGIKAARMALNQGIKVNMTLCFSQEQAAAVYAATVGTRKGEVFISPFVGRLDDKGVNGMDLARNIMDMYKEGNGHVQVLVSSVRHINHLLRAIDLGCDIVTAPLSILKEWATDGMSLPDEHYIYPDDIRLDRVRIPYKELNLSGCWCKDFNLYHPLTDVGLQKFADDWNKLLEK